MEDLEEDIIQLSAKTKDSGMTSMIVTFLKLMQVAFAAPGLIFFFTKEECDSLC